MSASGWMEKEHVVCTHAYVKSPATVEKVEIMSFAGKGIQLEVIILSKVRLRKYNNFLFVFLSLVNPRF